MADCPIKNGETIELTNGTYRMKKLLSEGGYAFVLRVELRNWRSSDPPPVRHAGLPPPLR